MNGALKTVALGAVGAVVGAFLVGKLKKAGYIEH